MFFQKNKNKNKLISYKQQEKLEKQINQETHNEEMYTKPHYVEVSNDFSPSELKPFQKLIIYKEKNKSKKYVVDFSISMKDVKRINSAPSINVKSFEIKSNRPFRFISQYDIDNAKGIVLNPKSDFKEYLSKESLSIDEAKEIDFEDGSIQTKTVNIDFNNDPNLNDLRFSNTENREQKATVKDIKNKMEKELLIKQFEFDEYNFSPIDENKFFTNKNKLIFDVSKPIKVELENDEKIVYPFKIRELNKNWNSLDYSEMKNSSLIQDFVSNMYINKDLFNDPHLDKAKQKDKFNKYRGLFFKVIYDDYNEEKIYQKRKADKFYKNSYGANIQQYKIKKLNNMIITRKKIDKKLLKEKDIKGYL